MPDYAVQPQPGQNAWVVVKYDPKAKKEIQLRWRFRSEGDAERYGNELLEKNRSLGWTPFTEAFIYEERFIKKLTMTLDGESIIHPSASN